MADGSSISSSSDQARQLAEQLGGEPLAQYNARSRFKDSSLQVWLQTYAPDQQLPQATIANKGRTVEQVAADLRQLVQQGATFESYRAIGREVNCHPNTAKKAMNEYPSLQALLSRNAKKPETISLSEYSTPSAASLSPAAQAGVNELQSDPALMEQKLQELIAQVRRQYSGSQRDKMIESLQQTPAGIDPAALFQLVEEQLQHDRRQQAMPKAR